MKLGKGLKKFSSQTQIYFEEEPNKFLDSEFVKISDRLYFSIKVFHKPNKLPMHWSSQMPRRYERNAVTCELHRALMISDEAIKIREKYANAGFP